MSRRVCSCLVALSLAASGCGRDATAEGPVPDPEEIPDGPGPRVLFVGNSLTAGHDVPGLVQAIAVAGGRPLNARSRTFGGFSLEDHWAGPARQALAGSKWDFVVLQQGPSTRPESQADLKEWATKWADEIRRHGATPALYMVWPFQNQVNGFELVSKSYRAAAVAADTRVFPAGEAWREAVRRDPAVALYTPDGLHATPAGSYLAALVIAHGLTGVRPRDAPARLTLPTGERFELPDAQADALRQAAEAAVGPQG